MQKATADQTKSGPRKYDGRESAHKRGYTSKWQKARATFLREHPLCAMHQALGRLVPASVVDHITPHRGDSVLFWDSGNWQALCKPCHDRHKQRLEKGGVLSGCDVNGLPIDPGHHWAASRG